MIITESPRKIYATGTAFLYNGNTVKFSTRFFNLLNILTQYMHHKYAVVCMGTAGSARRIRTQTYRQNERYCTLLEPRYLHMESRFLMCNTYVY